MSNFLYIHKDMSNEPDVHKVGKAIAPYSAVRARQKFIWSQFGLQYLYFGTTVDIALLESKIKKHFYLKSGSYLHGIGSQTELFKIDISELLEYINFVINNFNLNVRKIELEKDYTASKSTDCPFGMPSESLVSEWCKNKCQEIFDHNGELFKEKQTTFPKLFYVVGS